MPTLIRGSKIFEKENGSEAQQPTESESEFLITPNTATKSAQLGLSNLPTVDGEAGRGELNNAATWDDFPNGRFGDFKSPAFGDQGPWGGPGLSVRPFTPNASSELIFWYISERRSSRTMGLP